MLWVQCMNALDAVVMQCEINFTEAGVVVSPIMYISNLGFPI